MRVLLTGANGFVGSHILDRLLDAGHEVAVTLRPTSDTSQIDGCLPDVEVRYASLDSTESLRAACAGVAVVVHCAGKTKALRTREYYEVNGEGTRRLLEACQTAAGPPARFVLISSLAVTGPGTVEAPAREDAEPNPVSHYGRSKMLGETYVRELCRIPYTVLRPAAVYGPRDRDFLTAFRVAGGRIVPLISGGRQPVSLIHVEDVARAVEGCLAAAGAAGRTYHLAHPQPTTQKALLGTMAEAMDNRPICIPIPSLALYPLLALRQAWDRVLRRPGILNLQKVPEYRASGWVCSTERATSELAFTAQTPLEQGIARTLEWYRDHGWL